MKDIWYFLEKKEKPVYSSKKETKNKIGRKLKMSTAYLSQ